MQRVLLLLAVVLVALALPPLSSTAVGPDTTALRNAVTVAGIMEHEAELQAIANANGGTRASGTPGYATSVDYVADLLTGAGYDVTVQNFTYDQFVLNSSAFQRVSPDPKTYVEGLDAEYSPMDYSGAGDFTAPLALAGGITIPSPGGSTSGCSAADFEGFPAGAIALVQRGTCTFRERATNADAAGAAAVVIFNEGNDDPNDDRLGVIAGTLDPPQMDIPVIGTSFAVGEDLYNRVTSGQAVTVRVAVDAEVVTTATANVLADTPTGRTDRTVVVGAHLDSVGEGPGINDNGSGTSTILETALEMAELGSARRTSSASFTTEMDPRSVRTGPAARAASSRSSSTTSPARAWRRSPRSSTVARTTTRSSTRAFRPAGSSPGPKGSRHRNKLPCTAGRPASPTTPATTRRATRSRT